MICIIGCLNHAVGQSVLKSFQLMNINQIVHKAVVFLLHSAVSAKPSAVRSVSAGELGCLLCKRLYRLTYASSRQLLTCWSEALRYT